MDQLRSDDHEYSPREAMLTVIERVQAAIPDDLIVQWLDGEHVRFQHNGNIARLMMAGGNLTIANGDAGTPAPLALDRKITEYNVTAAVGRIEGFLRVGY